ncbi:1466_t:CDS:2 [Ambispora gerdemannii]|uniref:1466_t:CDS:1 n=1 Tax=Ambispora gerdemannii TaxID=144530 RepID=A0A9N9AG77_9GLOM|nr:1466_t:CDS:2 [Ambispora gerdemannii]
MVTATSEIELRRNRHVRRMISSISGASSREMRLEVKEIFANFAWFIFVEQPESKYAVRFANEVIEAMLMLFESSICSLNVRGLRLNCHGGAEIINNSYHQEIRNNWSISATIS